MVELGVLSLREWPFVDAARSIVKGGEKLGHGAHVEVGVERPVLAGVLAQGLQVLGRGAAQHLVAGDPRNVGSGPAQGYPPRRRGGVQRRGRASAVGAPSVVTPTVFESWLRPATLRACTAYTCARLSATEVSV